jgi:hypothetical protein
MRDPRDYDSVLWVYRLSAAISMAFPKPRQRFTDTAEQPGIHLPSTFYQHGYPQPARPS